MDRTGGRQWRHSRFSGREREEAMGRATQGSPERRGQEGQRTGEILRLESGHGQGSKGGEAEAACWPRSQFPEDRGSGDSGRPALGISASEQGALKSAGDSHMCGSHPWFLLFPRSTTQESDDMPQSFVNSLKNKPDPETIVASVQPGLGGVTRQRLKVQLPVHRNSLGSRGRPEAPGASAQPPPPAPGQAGSAARVRQALPLSPWEPG